MKKGSVGFVNGTVVTMEKGQKEAEGILIKDGLIELVGSGEEVAAAAGKEEIEVIDLKGKTVLPGFHDCHVHVMGTGTASAGANLYDCKSVKEVLETLKKEAQKNENGWVVGVRLDESRLVEKRPPSLKELSEAFPDRGVYLLDRGLHYTAVNQAAYDEIGFTGKEKGLGRDKEGQISGRMHEEANAKARAFFVNSMTREQREKAIHSVEEDAIRKGITTIHAMEGGEMFSDKDIPVFMDLEGKMKVDILIYWDTPDIDKIIQAGLPRVGTDLLSDGSIGSRTAAFDEPYADQPDTKGIMYYSEEFMTDLIEKALKNHLQCGFHAIGQTAIRHVLNSYEKAYAACPWEDARFRIEHFGFCDEEDIERAAKNKIIISTQPAFSLLRGGPGSVYQIRTGEERERKAYPNRKFVEAQIVVAGGSDSNVTPMDALLGIHGAVNHPYPEHRVSVEEALKMFTINGAYAGFEEKEKGSLVRGKKGDLVILETNPLTADQDKIKDISVEMTVKDGSIVYRKA